MKVTAEIREKIGFESVRIETEQYLYTPTGRQWIRTLQPLSMDSPLQERRTQMEELLWLHSTGQSLPFSRLDDIQMLYKERPSRELCCQRYMLSDSRACCSCAQSQR